MGGIAGLDVLNEMVAFIKKEMSNNVRVETIWKEKSVGFGQSGFDIVFVGLDNEDIDIYSLKYIDENGEPIWDWLHDVNFYIDIRTGKSEERVLSLADDVMDILKRNVIPVQASNNKNIQMLPTGIMPLHEDYRNLFRYKIDVTAKVFNP